jgi:pimeloyl-ACP methyl ester carboxylesterase
MSSTRPAVGLAVVLAIVIAAAGCARDDLHRVLEATMQTASNEPGPVQRTKTAPVENTSTPRMQAEQTGSGRPVVLIGGGLTGWASWEPHAARLAATREVTRLQLLSVQYGLEDRPLPDGYSVRMESRALAAALDELGRTGPVDLVAWSYGALVTLDFALNHPERVRTLTLIEPPALWTLPHRGRSLPDARALEALVTEIDDDDDVSIHALTSFLRTVALVPPGADPEALPQWDSWVRHRRSLRTTSAPFDHTDDPARLRELDRPVLLVTGHGTSPFLRAIHDTLAATLPDARTLELAGGHAPQLADMDGFLERLARFHADAGDATSLHAEAGAASAGDATSLHEADVASAGDGTTARARLDNDPAPEKQLVASRDGNRIAYWRSGSGPALLLVHGATADHTTTWRLVLPGLARHFTVYAMDRRGRGGSGDGADYELQREAEDVAAVIDAIGGCVSVLGHSYGALVAIEGARLTANVERLILYEGVPLRGADLFDPAIVAQLEALLRAGDVEGMLIAMYRDLVGMPAGEIEILRAQRDAWARRLANAPTLPRELAAERGYEFEPGRFADLRAPTMLLVGGDSPARELENARGVAAALPDARVVIMTGQHHAAMHAAPDEFVAEVVRFFPPKS